MTWTTCKYCGGTYSTAEEACPGCGTMPEDVEEPKYVLLIDGCYDHDDRMEYDTLDVAIREAARRAAGPLDPDVVVARIYVDSIFQRPEYVEERDKERKRRKARIAEAKAQRAREAEEAERAEYERLKAKYGEDA